MLDFYNYQIVLQYSGEFIQGFTATLTIASISLLLSLVLATLIALASLSKIRFLRIVITGYIEVIRATPLLVQIYLVYYLLGELPIINRRLDEWEGGILALTLNAAAFMSDIIRAGILSIAKGQIEAAQSLGMNRVQVFYHIIFPQALARVTAPLVGQTAVLVKDSSLVSFIGVFELFGAGLLLLDERLLANEGFFTVALGYLLIYALLSALAYGLQIKLSGRHQSSQVVRYA